MPKYARKHELLLSVNFHLWQPCNMRCSFCFATFSDVKQSCLPKGHLPEADAIKVVEALCDAGVRKITFAGGEPTLCPWLSELLQIARNRGVTTMIVTNGTCLESCWLNQHGHLIDWIALSVDSLDPQTNTQSGRKAPGKGAPDFNWYMEKVGLIKQAGIRFKVNTVVHRLNVHENMTPFIASSQPERWKLFQVLPIEGQNDNNVEDLLILSSEFDAFVRNHKQQLPNQVIIPESNDAMTGSYLMVDPAGRFYDNVGGRHTYSSPILEVGIDEALKDIKFDRNKFHSRGGLYEW